jgi:arsenic resistance protein ArsH
MLVAGGTVVVSEHRLQFTLLTRDRADYLVDRYSERKAAGRVTAGTELAAAAMAHETSNA